MFLSSESGFEGALPRKREIAPTKETNPKKKLKPNPKPKSHTLNIPSCGLTLLSGPKNAFDYVLRITSDDKQFVQINCHRCVLIAHSPQLGNLINGENFFDMSIKVKFGYIGACLELIQYFYLKDPSLISEKEKILELCGLFEMSLDHFLIRENKSETLDRYPMIKLNIMADESSSITTLDFLKCIEWKKAKLAVEESSVPKVEQFGNRGLEVEQLPKPCTLEIVEDRSPAVDLSPAVEPSNNRSPAVEPSGNRSPAVEQIHEKPERSYNLRKRKR